MKAKVNNGEKKCYALVDCYWRISDTNICTSPDECDSNIKPKKMEKNKPTPEHWETKVIKYCDEYVVKITVGNQSFLLGEPRKKSEAKWLKRMFEVALQNLIYGELQRYEIFKAINDFEGETVESIIEKYLK